MASMVIVQQIKTEWSKQSRGGVGAGRRNGVPEVAQLPPDSLRATDPVLVHHKLLYSEADSFQCPRETVVVNPAARPLRVGCVQIDVIEEAVVARFAYNQGCGAPNRGWMRKTLTLAVNEWGQIVYNGRFSEGDDGSWRYEKTVINVGLFAAPSDLAFTHSEPTLRYSAMGHLY